MGGGKRARAGLGHAARSRAARVGVRTEGDAAVRYHAHNGNEYRVDLSRMQQTKLATGSRRTVLREVLEGFGMVWSFESSRRGGRSRAGTDSESLTLDPCGGRSHQCAVYVQYPNEVCAVLEHRYRTFCATSLAVQQEPKSIKAAEAAVQKLNNASLRAIFGLNVAETSTGTEISTEISTTSGDDGDKCPKAAAPRHQTAPDIDEPAVSNSRRSKMKIAMRLASRVSISEPALADCLFERVLQTRWPPLEVASAVRWLHLRGLQCSPEHCRKAALLHGSLAVLRVLLIEAQVDVRGLELLMKAPAAASRGQAAANSGNGNSWVQRCKAAVKVLLARGAVIGGMGTRSKLLRKLEEDAELLLRARALATLCEPLPDVVMGHIGDFADVPAPYAWRDFQWNVQIGKASQL